MPKFFSVAALLWTSIALACASASTSVDPSGVWAADSTSMSQYLSFDHGSYLAITKAKGSGATTTRCEKGTYSVSGNVASVTLATGGGKSLRLELVGDTLRATLVVPGAPEDVTEYVRGAIPTDVKCN